MLWQNRAALTRTLTKSIHKKPFIVLYTAFVSRLTHVQRGRWSRGSSGFGCQASVVCSPVTLSSGSLQTCCLCGRWSAASCKAHVRAAIMKQNLLWTPKKIEHSGFEARQMLSDHSRSHARTLPVAVVNSISESWGVDYCEQQLDTTFLY